MKKINESQLLDKVSKLREYIAVVEGEQHNEDAASVGQAVGNAVGGAAGLATAPVRAVGDAASYVSNNAGKWWDNAKQGVSNFAGGVAQGAQQGWAATDPAKMAQAAMGAGQAAAPAATTKPAGNPDPAVMKLQQALIAKGAKIKADGIMGPATQAAQKQFGGQAAGATAAPAAPAATTAPPAPTGSAALNPNTPGANAATTIPSGGLENQANQAQKPAAAPAPTGSAALNPNAPGANAATTIPSGGLENQANQAQKPAAAPATAAVQNNANSSVQAESIGFQNDELSRLVSLVHYR